MIALVVGCVGYTFLLWFCLFYSPSEEWGVTEIHESDSCGTYPGFRVSSSCERLWDLEALVMLHLSSEDGTRLLIFIYEEETDISTELAPPDGGKTPVDRSTASNPVERPAR